MVTKLTLTVEKSVIEKAKVYATHSEVKEISPKLKRLVGAVKLPIDFDEKDALDA